MTPFEQWQQLPAALRASPQWQLAGPDDSGAMKAPYTVNAAGILQYGSPTNPACWLTFETACAAAAHYGYGIGYTLSASDPFCCVDLDVKDAENLPDKPHKWTTPEQLERFYSITAVLHSYAEFSVSGKGAHIWVRANIGEGCKRDGVEVYSQERFIVCTGNVIAPLPVANRQDVVNNMVISMRGQEDPSKLVALEELEAVATDDELWQRAATAENAQKFKDLCSGEWQKYHYPSQSEADLSLMSMFTFYSASDEQCRRMFRRTALGQRDKAIKDDRYINLTLRIVRTRQAREARALEMFKQQAQGVLTATVAAASPPPGPVDSVPGPAPAPAPQVEQAADAGLPWPPGFAGALARFVYDSAPRPVKEVSIVAALGWLAGVCGKVWVIPGSGLNMYIILVARSGIGKEAMHGGLGMLLGKLREQFPTASQFVDFSDFASGPALNKACVNSSSFVNVAGEWGRKLKRLAKDDGRDGSMDSLRTLMTNLYQKSGPSSIVGGISYSDKDKNVASVSGVAFSMIGETTPETFYSCLTESMMEDGFLSRFNIVEYDGLRPPPNPQPLTVPDAMLVSYCGQLCMKATASLTDHTRVPVQRDGEAARILDAFNAECDRTINANKDESIRQMWNRAHLKVCRIAALLAVGDCFTSPVVNRTHAEWALDMVRRDIALMQRKMEEGDVGSGDSAREKKVLTILKDYFVNGAPPSYSIPTEMRKRSIVPRSYLITRLQHVAVFSKHPLGSTRAIDDTIRSLVDSGYLLEADKGKLSEDFGFRGRCFQLMQVLR